MAFEAGKAPKITDIFPSAGFAAGVLSIDVADIGGIESGEDVATASGTEFGHKLINTIADKFLSALLADRPANLTFTKGDIEGLSPTSFAQEITVRAVLTADSAASNVVAETDGVSVA